ncbi:hypothetical protein M422DRAFT_238284 [Sphaerobolus stellatus SS14]|nr:hypothetical protein M422DRAFT_238284 [Sphaerobolus stellatus SS14]
MHFYEHSDMDRFYAPSSPEATSFRTVKNDGFWDESASQTTLMGLCASYVALARFMSGQDLYIAPRNGVELYNTLRSYTFDALHNLISQSRRELPVGGYSLACEVASNSILAMLGTDSNTSYLLSLHPPTPYSRRGSSSRSSRSSHRKPSPPTEGPGEQFGVGSPPRSVRT